MRKMTTEQKIKRTVMQHSVTDAIKVLENNPVQPDMVAKLTIAQVMNRVSTAHLSIERTMKFLITEAGGPLVKDHDLPSRLNELRQYEPASAEFLEEAFTAAVQHYRYNANARHMKHLQSLETYLNATGSDKDFQDIRYWELSQSTDEILVREIYLSLHLELLHAVRELLMPSGRTKETVSLRVERALQTAMRPRNLAYAPGTDRELSVKSYLEWISRFQSDREAMTKALREGEAPDEQFTLEMLKRANQELSNSTDPAVRYFAEILTVLPHQSRDAIPCVEWLGQEKYQTGEVSTPGGDNLGFIFRRRDGLWAIEPTIDGPAMITNIAETQTDAKCFLASLLTRPTQTTVNGEEKNLRIFGEGHNLFNRNYNQEAKWNDQTDESQFPTHEVDFWDTEHGISEGNLIKVETPNETFEDLLNVLEGTVTGVQGHKVFVHGTDYVASTEPRSSPTR